VKRPPSGSKHGILSTVYNDARAKAFKSDEAGGRPKESSSFTTNNEEQHGGKRPLSVDEKEKHDEDFDGAWAESRREHESPAARQQARRYGMHERSG
jgi:hypothetical protein